MMNNFSFASNMSNFTSKANTQNKVHEVFTDQVEIILQILYVLVSVVAITGNVLVIFLVAFKKVSRTAFTILLTNLSAADLIASISLYPYVFIDIEGWNISKTEGRILCNFTIGLTIYFICTAVSLLTLTTISVNRYICINYPLKFSWQQGEHGSKIFVAITWLISIFIMSPNFISFVYLKDWAICRRTWPGGINGTLYSSITALLGLVVPIIVLLYTFLATLKNLKTKVSDVPRCQFVQQTMPSYARKRTIRLLGWLIVVFSLCWTPFFIYWILSRSLNVFSEGNDGDYERMRVLRLTILIAEINTAIDPLFYGLFSEQYRTALKTIFKRSKERSRVDSIMSVSTIVTTKHKMSTVSNQSTFSVKAIEEEGEKEYGENLTPKSSIAMAHVSTDSFVVFHKESL